ncbi:hypothetical protein B6U91_01955, partial [Candidatus Pacearchaeota archaeon ex4484_71]
MFSRHKTTLKEKKRESELVLSFFVALFVLSSFGFVSAVHDTSLQIYEEGNDNRSLPGEWTTFYANYTSDEGYNLGQILYRNPEVVGGGNYYPEKSPILFDWDGDGVRTDIALHSPGVFKAFYYNGTEIWGNNGYAFSYTDIIVGDFNNDSIEEFAMMNYVGQARIINSSDGTTIQYLGDLGYGYSIGNGDFDGDGIKDDLVFGTNTGLRAYSYNKSIGTMQNIWEYSMTGGVIEV